MFIFFPFVWSIIFFFFIQEVNSLRRTLEVKNKELLSLEEKLTARGRVSPSA